MSPGIVAKSSILNARRLRSEMSEGEKFLWKLLKTFRISHGIHVRRQVPIGPYIADFAIHSAKLLIEVDGPMHSEVQRQNRDRMRDEWLAQAGYRVIRFRTDEVMNSWSNCAERILREAGVAN
jgi:very-short-patch-repair endonuclease